MEAGATWQSGAGGVLADALADFAGAALCAARATALDPDAMANPALVTNSRRRIVRALSHGRVGRAREYTASHDGIGGVDSVRGRRVVYMHYTNTTDSMSAERRMIETCACHKIRMAARAVTRTYDEALRPVGLRATQAALLAAIAVEGAMSITSLARWIGMDRSTLTRNLTPLEKEGLLAVGSEGWRRSRTLEITAKGRARLQEAMPLWEAAQKRLKQDLGGQRWGDVQSSLDHLVRTSSRPRTFGTS
jgi:DNA-binding MarR family transcriptional regulator